VKTVSAILVVLLFCGLASGQSISFVDHNDELPVVSSVPRTMTYQGILKDSGGDPVTNQTVNIIFRIYDDLNTGTMEWTETITGVQTDGGGYFNATFSNVNLPFDEDYWLELEISGEASPMSPRQKINMSAYAARADTADAIAPPLELSASIDLTSTPNAVITSSNSNNGWGISAHNTATDDHAYLGGYGYGVYGESNITGAIAVYGYNSHYATRGYLGDQVGVHGDNMTSGYAGYLGGLNYAGYFNGDVGIGTDMPSEALEVVGTAKVDGFEMATGAVDGYVLTSDASGVGTWQAATGGGATYWSVVDSVLTMNNYWGISRFGNHNTGTEKHTFVNLGVACTTGQMYPGVTISGGIGNKAFGECTVISGGTLNNINGASSNYSFIGGGDSNNIDASKWAVLCGGNTNTISGNSANMSFMGGGYNNSISAQVSVVAGGENNVINTNGTWSTIGGGSGNSIESYYGSISGGVQNEILPNSENSTIGGGRYNDAGANSSTIGGGDHNRAIGHETCVSGGSFNYAGDAVDDTCAFVGGGHENEATSKYAAISGGYINIASGEYSTIGGGGNNQVTSGTGTISGGAGNIVSGYSASIGGGFTNVASSFYTTVSGGFENNAGGDRSTVGGGDNNFSTGDYATIGGGWSNNSSNNSSTVSGGSQNAAGGQFSTTGGGFNNRANGDESTVSGGADNFTPGVAATVGGGRENSAGGPDGSTVSGGITNQSNGMASTVCGGQANTANADFSTIGGGLEHLNDGPFSAIIGGWRDTIYVSAMMSAAFGENVLLGNPYRTAFYCGRWSGFFGINRDTFDGGINFPIHVGTNVTNGNGAHLTPGGVWVNTSSRTFKENFLSLDHQQLLSKISALPVKSYNYKNSNERHVGPMAEDFVAAFDVGTIRDRDGQRENQYLAAGDVAGVALAGVQALLDKIEQLENRIAELEAQKR